MRKLITMLGLSMLVANNIILYLTFQYAYFFNDYRYCININSIGEAYFEFICLSISFLIGLIATYHIGKMVMNNEI